jgi:hypothetical protein
MLRQNGKKLPLLPVIAESTIHFTFTTIVRFLLDLSDLSWFSPRFIFLSSGQDSESNEIEASGLESKSVEASRSGKSRFDHKSAKNEKSRKSFVVQSVIDTPDGISMLLSHFQFILLDLYLENFYRL